jgi:hypothetical protein
MRLAFAALLTFAACDSLGGNSPDAGPGDQVDAARHVFPDARFKWVGSGVTLMVSESKTIAGGSTQANDTYHDTTTILPMQVGGAGTWQYYHAATTIPIAANDARVQTNVVVDTVDIEAAMISGLTITALDIGNGDYAFSGARALADSFDSHTYKENETRANLAADVASYGALSQVTTALGGPDGSMVVAAEQLGGDTNTYQTMVVDATLTNLMSQAQTLASAGYVITAAGIMGDPNQIVLVGTKMPGGAASYSIMAVTGAGQNVNIDSALAAGYEVVANVYDPTTGSHVILEK